MARTELEVVAGTHPSSIGRWIPLRRGVRLPCRVVPRFIATLPTRLTRHV